MFKTKQITIEGVNCEAEANCDGDITSICIEADQYGAESTAESKNVDEAFNAAVDDVAQQIIEEKQRREDAEKSLEEFEELASKYE